MSVISLCFASDSTQAAITASSSRAGTMAVIPPLVYGVAREDEVTLELLAVAKFGIFWCSIGISGRPDAVTYALKIGYYNGHASGAKNRCVDCCGACRGHLGPIRHAQLSPG